MTRSRAWMRSSSSASPSSSSSEESEPVFRASSSDVRGLRRRRLQQTSVIVVSVVVGFFGVGSAVLGLIAEGTKLEGAAWNAPVTREVNTGCYFVRDGVFRRAAILSIIATVLGIKSYFLLRAAAATATATAAAAAPGCPGAVAGPSSAGEPKSDGIAMGHPAPMYGQAPYAHYPPPPNAQGYGQYPPPPNAQGYGGQYPPPAQGYGQFHPAAPPQGQGYGQAV
ncbi:hypothetical protein TRIUR3_26844 [Triticum urartu]|uniref:Uncharacterized protein n=1 Tax=Triticum urartu TaxID=4572 RepID=M7YZH6_TRIUA|nr:hypothetical protein TRIUR3_26844 [Triticum urartu]